MTNLEMRTWIDNASYKELLRRWRFSKPGDPMCSGSIGACLMKKMTKLREEIGDKAHSAISEEIGW